METAPSHQSAVFRNRELADASQLSIRDAVRGYALRPLAVVGMAER